MDNLTIYGAAYQEFPDDYPAEMYDRSEVDRIIGLLCSELETVGRNWRAAAATVEFLDIEVSTLRGMYIELQGDLATLQPLAEIGRLAVDEDEAWEGTHHQWNEANQKKRKAIVAYIAAHPTHGTSE